MVAKEIPEQVRNDRSGRRDSGKNPEWQQSYGKVH